MDMDWEPELPGQWNTPLRIRHQRVTTEAGFPTTLSHTERPVTTDYPTDWEPEIPGQFNTPLRIRRKRTAAEAGFSEAESDTGSHAPNITLQALIPKSCFVAPITNILAYTFRIFRHIYSATVKGARISGSAASTVAGSKQVIEIRKVAANGFESVKRRVIDSGLTRPVAPAGEQIARNRNAVAQPKSLRSSHRNAETRNMVPSTGSSLERVSPQSDTPIEQMLPHLEAPLGRNSPPLRAQISPPKLQAPEPPIDREALGAKLWASFTPRPIPGSRGMLAISQQSAPTPLMDGQQNSSSNIETSVIKPLAEKPILPKFHNILSSTFSRPEKRIKPSLKSFPTEHESRRMPNYTHSGSSRLPKRPSLPQLSASEMHGLPARSNTISVTPKQVRFAMNDTNGLPQEYSVRFYKDSKIGEWVPSSPWADEQLLACTSDLNYNLDALLREDSWLPPPSTPVLNLAEPFYSGEGSSIALEEHHASEPQGTASSSLISPSSISDSSSISVEIFKDLNHSIGEEQLVEENPTVQAPATSSVPSSPYTRIRELVKDSFRKVFSPSLQVTPQDSVNRNRTHEAMGISIAYNDTSSQMDELNNSSSLFDSPKISNYTPSNTEGGMDHALNGNKYRSGLVGSHIEIDGNDGSQYAFVDNGSGGSAGHLRGSDGSDDHYITPRKEEDPVDAELEHVMKTLKMSTFGTRRLAARRKEQEAAAAARKTAEEAAAAKAKAEAEEAERRARSHRRVPKEKLVKPLSKDWEAKISEAMGRGDNAALTTTVTGTELRRKDFMTVLGERQWLNDEIINAYIEWVVEYANKKAGKNGRNAIPKVVAHNSFFYKNLSENGPKSVSRWMKRKKAEGKKLLEVETVLIPVNNASHWTIIVVSPKERTIEYLDSFSGASKAFINNTKGWLKEELGNAWQEEDWRVLQTRSAVQNNGYDCGVFCITNAECVAGGVDTASYDGSDMADQRQRIAGVLLNRGFGGDFVPAEEL